MELEQEKLNYENQLKHMKMKGLFRQNGTFVCGASCRCHLFYIIDCIFHELLNRNFYLGNKVDNQLLVT